jgi:hypothetical protein
VIRIDALWLAVEPEADEPAGFAGRFRFLADSSEHRNEPSPPFIDRLRAAA